MNMAENSPKGKKTLWEKEKLLVMNNLSFSHSVFKRCVLLDMYNLGLVWERVNMGKYLPKKGEGLQK